ncbi:MAG: methylmalonyl Co-A mutase-associated GTPase MeaB, partial [Chloroflexota bacterium]|nr:methylmalonyl Co-A mutase-associated GTPase MeaB [Chloroflexota bacterium]
TTVVVSVPGLGDDVQAIKAGVLEIADVHVVNKADREGADRVRAQLKDMLRMVKPADADAWTVPVHPTVAQRGDGVAQLCDMLDAHRSWLVRSGTLERRERQIAATRVIAIVAALVRRRLAEPSGEDFDAIVDEVARRKLDPARAAATLLEANVGRQR